jgi:L-malate glycosyltransferase
VVLREAFGVEEYAGCGLLNEQLRSLRIGLAIDTLDASGGTELHVLRAAILLQRHGHQVSVVTLNGRGALAQVYAQHGIGVLVLPFESSIASLPRMLLAGVKVFREARFDVVQSHDIYTSTWVTLLSRLARVPRILASKRWTVVASKKWERLVRIGYALAHTVVANSRAVSVTLVTSDNVPISKIAVIQNFLEDDVFVRLSDSEIDSWTARLGLTTHGPIIGCVAQLRPEKGVDTLVAALQYVIPSATLVLVGEGVERGRLELLAESLGVSHRVRFLGRLDRVPSSHQLFDISVLPSRNEGMPNALIEAMAIGNPVVATDIPAVREIVTSGVEGLLAPVGEPEHLARAINDLLASPIVAARMGAAGRDAVSQRHSAAVFLAASEALYRMDTLERAC